jgi:formylglycine-generating enzyme required for sulfatase activity
MKIILKPVDTKSPNQSKRGGSWSGDEVLTQFSYRYDRSKRSREGDWIGFRMVRNR